MKDFESLQVGFVLHKRYVVIKYTIKRPSFQNPSEGAGEYLETCTPSNCLDMFCEYSKLLHASSMTCKL